MKVSVVVGGTKGIGQVIANSLRKRGDCVYTVSRRKYDQDHHIRFDISLENSSVLADRINSKIDYLIFSQRYRGSEWSQEFNLSVKATHNIIESMRPKLCDEASVVIIGSNSSQFVLDEATIQYHASRASLEMLLRYFAVKYGKDGIRFNSVLPSTLIKPENLNFFAKTNKLRKVLEAITPLNRMGTAQDVADVVEFLCSDKSSFLTGQSLMVDGGLSLRGQESIAKHFIN